MVFGDEDNDPIDILITLAAVDQESHNVRGITQVVNLFEDEDNFDKLRAARTPEEVIALIEQAEAWCEAGIGQVVYHRSRDAQAADVAWGESDINTGRKLADMGFKVTDTGIRTVQLAGYDVYYEPGNEQTLALFKVRSASGHRLG